MTRRQKLGEIFDAIETDQRELIDPLLDEVVFLEDRMKELRRLPFVRVKSDDPSMQKSTPAAREYKHCMQSYMNAIRILSSALRKAETDAADELMARLEEFTA